MKSTSAFVVFINTTVYDLTSESSTHIYVPPLVYSRLVWGHHNIGVHTSTSWYPMNVFAWSLWMHDIIWHIPTNRFNLAFAHHSASRSYASLPHSILAVICLSSLLSDCTTDTLHREATVHPSLSCFLSPLFADERQALHSIMKDLVALQMTRRQPSYDTGKPKTPGPAPSPGPAPAKIKRQVQRPVRL